MRQRVFRFHDRPRCFSAFIVQAVEVPYVYDGAEFKQMLRYRVADTTKPLIINPGTNFYHKVNTAFDIQNYIGYADNYDAKPGDVIQIAPGTYDYSEYQGAQKIDTKAAGCMWWTAGSVTSAFNIIWWITAAV